MVRKATKIASRSNGRVGFYVDNLVITQILEYLFESDVVLDFKTIVDLLGEGKRNHEKYCKANVSEKAKDVFEMRFTNKGRNDRIYCKEVHKPQIRSIILIDLYRGKKTQYIPKEQKKRIETIGGYSYEL